MPVNVKRGRHTARWGEGLLLPGRQPLASLGMRSRLLATGVARSTQL